MGLQICFQLCHKKNEYIKYLFMSQGRLSPGKGHSPGQSGEFFGTVISVTPQALGAWGQEPPVLLGLGSSLPL